MKQTNKAHWHHSSSIFSLPLLLCLFLLWPCPGSAAVDSTENEEQFFTLSDGTDLRVLGGPEVRQLLVRRKGRGADFGAKQAKQYCRLKQNKAIQWSLIELETGMVLSSSPNAGEVFFGASASKVFVAAALLDEQDGKISKKQLILMSRMIVRSNNPAWRELQRQCGPDSSDDAGRQAVHDFIAKMGYENLRAFQGWMTRPDGSRLHGNELNSLDVAKFLFDTYHNRYAGAEILWKIMQATRTGTKKIDKYTPSSIYIAGKTGTYHGSNESKDTIKHAALKAMNHIAVLNIDDKYYGMTILSNTGKNEDVAVLGGGLMREYLGVEKSVQCPEKKKGNQ